MRILSICIALAVGLASCKTGDFQTTDSGLDYIIHTENEGPKPNNGDYVYIHAILKAPNDSIIDNTYEEGEPALIRMQESVFQGDIFEGIKLLSEGDSATFLISADSMAGLTGLKPENPDIPAGSKLTFQIKLVDILNQEEFQQEMQKKQLEAVQKSKEMVNAQAAEIEKYLQGKNLQAQKSPTGLYYIIEKEGTGATPKAGDIISVDYRGYLMDGEVFDNSYDRGEPIEFQVGTGQVIPGWDEGLMLFKEGGKGKLIIPSPLAYGDRPAGIIPPNSILIFDIELHKVKKAPTAE